MAETAVTRPDERGFSIIEMMIALTVLIIGISGVLAFQLVSMKGASYSRHATEAAVLAEDKMEQLRTIPVGDIPTSPVSETVDEQGIPVTDGYYTRTWSITWNSGVGSLKVVVSWNEGGDEPHEFVYETQRSL